MELSGRKKKRKRREGRIKRRMFINEERTILYPFLSFISLYHIHLHYLCLLILKDTSFNQKNSIRGRRRRRENGTREGRERERKKKIKDSERICVYYYLGWHFSILSFSSLSLSLSSIFFSSSILFFSLLSLISGFLSFSIFSSTLLCPEESVPSSPDSSVIISVSSFSPSCPPSDAVSESSS
jgi:hypothetical protein